MTKNSAKVRQNFCRTEPNLPKSAEPRTEPKFRSLPITGYGSSTIFDIKLYHNKQGYKV